MTSNKNKHLTTLWIVLGLGCIGWFGLYLFTSDFGIYEDDYFFTLPVYQFTLGQLWLNIKNAWIYWPQFRPLGFSLTHLVSYATAQFDSLVPGYLLGFGLHTLNGWLLFRIASKSVRPAIAFIAAAVFILYPSDTGKVILMLRVFQVLNLTMVLTAILLYLRGRRVFAYIMATGCLLIYEHFFLAFLIAPFLAGKFKPFPFRRVVLHFGLCASLPAVLIVARKLLGDERSTDVLGAPLVTLGKMVQACIIGPRTALISMFERPLDALGNSDGLQWGVILVIAALTLLVIQVLSSNPDDNQSATQLDEQRLTTFDLGWLGVGALVCFALSYLLAIRPDNFPPIVNLGRLSGFNAPGSISCSLLFAAMAEMLFRKFPRRKLLFAASGAFYVGLLVSVGIELQRSDYVRNWRQQKNAWTTIFASSGEWKPGVPIIIDVRNADAPDYYTRAFPFYWMVISTPLGAPNFLEPKTWAHLSSTAELAPRVYGFHPELGAETVKSGLLLHTPPWSGREIWPILKPNGFILFHFESGKLVRTNAPLVLPQGQYGSLAPPSTEPAPLALSRVYRILFRPPTEWASLARGRNYPR